MEELLLLIEKYMRAETLTKIVFSRPRAGQIVKTACRFVLIKGQRMLQTERFMKDGKALQENLSEFEAIDRMRALCGEFRQVDLITTGGNCEALIAKDGRVHLKNNVKESQKKAEIAGNDREHRYLLDPALCSGFLSKLGVCDENGRIYDKKRAKFRQINRFVEILDDAYPFLPQSGSLCVCDFCCGKSYLTFAVYFYLTVLKERSVTLYGVDLKSDVIDFCRKTAQELGYDGMSFDCMNVFDFHKTDRADLVLSLHACDVATDIVLYNAVRLQAKVILSTPCCHHEMMNQLKCEQLAFVSQHSMYRQKLCDSLTDALRCKRLEAEGYKVTALELIDPEETPKNILIKAIRRKLPEDKRKKALEDYRSAAEFLGVHPYLDRLFEERGRDISSSEALASGGEPVLTDADAANGRNLIPTDTIDRRLIPALHRSDRAHKGSCGCVGIVAGSRNMAGACFFAAKAAYSCGAGLVRIVTPECNREIMQVLLPEALLFTYDSQEDESGIPEFLSPCTTVVMGPGLGRSEQSERIVSLILKTLDKPLVLDADALFFTSLRPGIVNYPSPVVMTPHMGEAARMLGKTPEEISSDPLSSVKQLQQSYGHTVLLKDMHTLICDGRQTFINCSGCSGMAKGGSGDLLSGMIGVFLRQCDPAIAAAFSAYIHGLAGELSEKTHGKLSMLASHAFESIGEVLKDFFVVD